MAIAELLVKHAIIQRKFGHCAGGFRDQLALDGQRRSLLAGEAAELVARRIGSLLPLEAPARLSAAAARAIGLRALPARRRVAGAEGFDIVEARGAVAAGAAPAPAAF